MSTMFWGWLAGMVVAMVIALSCHVGFLGSVVLGYTLSMLGGLIGDGLGSP